MDEPRPTETTASEVGAEREARHSHDRVLYVVAPDAVVIGADHTLNLLDLWQLLWRRRLWIIAISALFAVMAIPYAWFQTEWYRAEILLAPVEEQLGDSISRQLGGLAGLAGVSVGRSKVQEPLAVLQSRDFIRAFIEEENLLPTLFAEQWDSDANEWKDESGAVPDMRDAVKLFLNDVLIVESDSRTGLVTVATMWSDPVVAAEWANLLVARLNDHLRGRALVDARRNVDFLQTELSSSNVVTLQQSIGRLLESEMQKLMLARGNEEFAFRIVDSPEVPKNRFKPNRTLIVILATLFGGMLSVLGVFLASAIGAARNHFRNTVDTSRNQATSRAAS